MVNFTALEPTLHTGLEAVPVDPTELVFTAAVADGDGVPISDSMLTMVFLKNASVTTPYDVTFPANVYTDTAGSAGYGLADAVVTVPAESTMLVGPLLTYRYAGVMGYNAIDYGGGEADLSVAVVNVPYGSI